MTAAEPPADLVAGLGDGLRAGVVVVAEVAGATPAVDSASPTWSPCTPTRRRPDGADPDDDLGWYATQEIADLLSGN